MIKIQGLTQEKQTEIEEYLNNNTIICLTETQHKFLRVNIANDIEHIHSHRIDTDKKGGGLSIMFHKNNDRSIEQVKTNHKDILHVKCTVKKYTFRIILTYMATNDSKRNQQNINGN